VRRLRSGPYWVLCALAEGEAHGYLVSQRIKALARDEIGVGPGTLYAAIERLASTGMIELAREEVVEGRNRRSYRITDKGRAAAAMETEVRADAVSTARRQLGLA
jgi:DNA-binding PadR family transcriptional regulator